MRVLVAGATGVIGRALLPLLAAVGHDVVALVRPSSDSDWQRVRVVEADALDRDAVHTAIRRVSPDAVVNLLSAIPKRLNPRRYASQMAATNRLRTEGTANLRDAAADARLISAGLAYAYRPANGSVCDEDQPLWDDGPHQFRLAVRALHELERLTAEVRGVVLRFGHLYGAGTMFARDGSFMEQVHTGRASIVGAGSAVFSFTHTHDAATSIVAALDKPVTGALNVVDDHPAAVREWLPELARLVDGPPPRHVPAAVARLAVGGWGVAFMTSLVGADNRRARLYLDWRPCYTSWREGLASEFTKPAQRASLR
jgi:nucleoside-diphosphate-sugar epimerase